MHHLWIVLHHHQRIARIAQSVHHADDTAHIARMQADRRLIQHEQGVGERSAQRRGEIDTLHLTAGQRARLPVQRQITQTDIRQILEPRADLGQQHGGGFVGHLRQTQRTQALAHGGERQQHQIVHGEARQMCEFFGIKPHAAWQEPLCIWGVGTEPPG